MNSARVLFACRPLSGHYHPLVPLAEAVREAGHQVAFATGEPVLEQAREAGFEGFAAGPTEAFREEWGPRYPGYDLLVGDEQRRFFFSEIFAHLELVPRAEDLERIVPEWVPDLIVHEVAELAAPLIATAHGIPYVDVSYGPLIPMDVLRAAGEAAAPHWRSRGLEPHPTAGLFRYLYVDSCPPSLQDPENALIASVQPMRPAAAPVLEAEPPPWLEVDGPLVYLTLGTIWNRNLDIFRCVIEALRDQKLTLVVTVGRQNDPAALGPQPANVMVHSYVRQETLLPRCSAVITHGGAGTTLGALAFGLPLLVIPQGADQYANADRVVAAGAGRRLLTQELSVPAVVEAVAALLEDPSYRLAATRIQAEITAMPPASDVVTSLEALLAPG